MSRFFYKWKKADSFIQNLSEKMVSWPRLGVDVYANFFESSPIPRLKKGFILLLFSLMWTVSASAQIQFKVELLSDNATYRVSLLPSVTWTDPDNITSTAQVTLKVPTGGMGIANVTSLIPGTFWANNARYNSPPEETGFDYISFGLTSLGTSAITYESGVETHLFTFTNDGICTGAAEVMLDDDPFFPPNSLNANVSTQITTFGGGTGVNIFSGAYGVGGANCQASTECVVEYQIAQLGDGSYSVAMLADTAWNFPLNITDSMLTTLVVPTGTFSPGNLMSTQPGVEFILTDSFISPPESPNSDYFVFELASNGTASLNYQRGLTVPLFSFENLGNCESDSLFLMQEDDPFAMPNSQNGTVGHFIKTIGSDGLIELCASSSKAPIAPEITEVTVGNLTNCESDNGSITIETSSFAAIQYSIDTGMTWQTANNFPLLPEGEYWVAIRYAGGTCEMLYDANPVIVEAPAPPTFNGSFVSNPNGCGNENGSISLSASSDISPEYSIDNGETWSFTNNFTGLGVGTYITKIRNGNMTCEVPGDTVTLAFSGPTSPVIDSIDFNNLTSCTAANGGLSIFSSDTLDLEYSIDNGETWSPNANFIDLSEGVYNVIVRNDSTDCPTVYDQNPVIIGNDEDCNNCLAEYELELLADGRYQVSVIPDTTWNFPFNITSTAQVTIVVATGSFVVSELTNLIPGVTFNDNSRQNAPMENPDYDYISFGLESLGTTNIPYETGVKVPLFTFKNSGFCTGSEVRLMERDDPFAFPNSQSINVGQQLTTAGSGQDGLVCVKFPGFTFCIPRVEAEPDFFNVYINSTIIENVIENDTNYLNNGLNSFFINGSTTDNGTVDLQQDGTVTYTPDQDFTGIDTMLYQVCGDTFPTTCSVGLITFAVTAGNALEAFDDSLSTFVNTSVNGVASLNDVNPDDFGLHYTLSMPPSNGTVSLNPDGTFTYQPNIGFVGFDFFLYKVCDDGFPEICDFAQVKITVNGSTELVAIDDDYFGMLNSSISNTVLTNDFNPNGGNLTTTLLTGSNVAFGNLILNADGTFTYTPNNGFVGNDGFDYVVCNDNFAAECDTAHVNLTIVSEIMANDDFYQIPVNTTGNANVIDNDLYANGVNINVTLLNDVSNGTLILNADGSCTYTPNFGFTGLDMFDYILCDDGMPQTCDTATVQIVVQPDIQAVNDNFNVEINSNFNGTVINNDSYSAGISIVYSLAQNVANGSLIFNFDGTFMYMPNNGFVGIDSFQYNLCDTGMPQTCSLATVYLNVSSSIFAVDDSFTATANTSFQNTVITNDIIPNGVSTTTTHVINPSNGALFLEADGSFTYLPDNGFSGVDSFYYRLCDDAFPFPCDTALVTLNVLPQLIAVNDAFGVNFNGSLSESVVTNDTWDVNIGINVSVISNVTNGTLVMNANGTFDYFPNANYLGPDQFEYQICYDTNPVVCETAIVTLNVQALVTAVDDNISITQNGTATGNVADNDFPNNGNYTVILVANSGPNNGTLTLNIDGTYTYISNAGFTGTDSFQYEFCNGGNPPLCDIATVTITVTAPILAVDDDLTTPAGTDISGNVIDNDQFPNGANITVTLVPNSGPNNGILILNPNGTYNYTPNPNFMGTDVFQYEICDDSNPQNCSIATVTILVGMPTDLLDAVDDEYDTPVNVAVTQNVIDNDIFPMGTNVTVTLIPNTGPANGILILNQDGTFTYTPNTNFAGGDEFTYIICDDNSPQNCALATVTLNVGTYIQAVDDISNTPINITLTGNVIDNDNFPTGTVVTVTLVPNSGPNNGTLTLNPDGTYVYDPDPLFEGTDVFEYEICDDNTPQNCDIATVEITVGNPPIAMDAIDDEYETPVNTTISDNVSTNDIFPMGTNITVTLIPNSGPANGNLILNPDGTFIYTPEQDFNGTVEFDYVICDDNTPQNCDQATVIINVGAYIDAIDDNVQTPVGEAVAGDVTDNDQFPDGTDVTVTLVSGPDNGTLTLNSDGTFIYNPDPNYDGFDVFEYEICDDNTPQNCDIATVIILIGDPPNPIFANNDNFETPFNTSITEVITTNDIVLNGGNTTTALVPNSGPANGTVIVNLDGTFTYTPNTGFSGTDAFDYVLCDDDSPANCDVATVEITVTPNPVVAVDDEINTPADEPVTGNVIDNDQFPNGSNPTVTLVPNSGPDNGDLILNPDGTYTYTPDPGFEGYDSFDYEICDDNTPPNCDVATVIITVGTPPDPLDAIDDEYETPVNVAVTDDVTTNDIFPTGSNITVTLIPNSGPANGNVVLNPNGTFTYTPNNNYVGADEFDYLICNDNTPQSCDIATVTINIGIFVEAVDDVVETPIDTPITGDVTDNDNFPTGTNVTVTLVPNSGPDNGDLVLNPDGTFTYTPDPNFEGTDVFEYEICDDNTPQNCDTGIVIITVGNPPPAIEANDDEYETPVNVAVFDNVIDNDIFPNGTNITTTLIPNSGPTNGTLAFNTDGTFLYTPNQDFTGIDVFDYEICDDNTPQNCDIATVTIYIGDYVDAMDDVVNTPVDTPITGDVTDNDNFPTGTNVTVTLVPNSGPDNGDVILNPDGTYTYTPDPDFEGYDIFEYEICDDNTPPNCDVATVIITVGNPENPILAVDDEDETPYQTPTTGDVIDNDIYPDGTTITVAQVPNTGPNNGTVVLNPDGTYTYTPNAGFTGTDSFDYVICDDASPSNCDMATVEITVLSNPVVAMNDVIITPEGTTVTGSVVDNDQFPNGSNPTVTLIPNSGPNNGTVTLNPDGTYTYVPNPGFNGTDSFEYEICDDNTPPNCDTGIVTINVMNPPTLTAIDDFYQTNVNTPVSGNIILNDENPNGSVLTVNTTPISQPTFGTVSINSNGNYTYTPNPNYVGNDSFEYEVCDDANPQNCDIATVFITINNNNGGGGSNLQQPLIVCPDEVCGNSMMSFTIDQFYSGTTIEFEWVNATGTMISNTPTLDIAPNDPDAIQPFFVRVNVDGEYTDYSTACFVEQASIPALSVTNSGPQVCNGTEVQLLATPMANVSYEWRLLGEPTVLSTLPNPMMPVDGNAIYQLTVTRVDCPFATDTYATSVQAVDEPDFEIEADYNMGADCVPEPLELRVNITGDTTGLTYLWESANGFYSNEANPILQNVGAAENGMYMLTVTNELGCSAIRTMGINNILDFIPEPIITYSGPVCMGEEVELITQYYAGYDVDYVWMKNGSIMTGNSSNQLIVQPFSPDDAGMYRVMVKVDNCIHESEEFQIEILETPELAPNFSLTQPCEGGELTLNSNTIAGAQNATYSWTGPNGFTSNAQNPIIPNTTIAHNGSYVLTMMAENGCQKSESFDVEFITAIPAKPAAFANGPICEEGNVILTIQNPPTGNTVNYEWKNGNGIVVGNTEVLTMGATDPLMISPFSVKVTADGCESDLSDPIEVTVENPATPELTINSDFLCEGESLSLNASLYNGQNTSYQWYFDNGTSIVPLSITSTATLFVNDVDINNEGLYFVVAQVNGCATDTSNIQQVQVFSQASPPLATNSSELNPACFGENVQLEVPLITGATYQWYGPAGFSSTVINPVLANATDAQAGEYFAVINFNGCNITSSPTMVQVQEELPTPFLLINNGQNEACEGGDLTLEITNPTAGATFEFYNAQTGERLDSTTNSTITINDITAAQAGQYYATSVVNGCSSPLSNYFEIAVTNAPNNVAEAGDNQTLCSDFETLNLNAVTPGSGSGQWTALNSGTVLNPNQANTQVVGLEEGVNEFVWTLSTAACGEYSTDTVAIFTDAIDAMDDDFAAFVNDTMPPVNLIANDQVGNPDSYTFNVVTVPSQGELIDLGNGLISYMPFPGAFGADQFTYMICSNECDEICDMATVVITLVGNDDEDYFVPNTITPNGDGINDAFVVPATIQFPGSEVAIFNRLGDEVYFSEDYQNDWEGTYKDKPLPVGTYFYCVRLTDEAKTVLRGYVVVKR